MKVRIFGGIFGVTLGRTWGAAGRSASQTGLAQVGMGAEYAAHELHELSGSGRSVQGVGQGVNLVLDRPDKELPEALVGKAGVLEGVPDPVPLDNDAPQLLV